MRITYNRTRLQYYLDFIIEHCILAVAFFLPLSIDVTTVFLIAGVATWLGKMLMSLDFSLRRSPFDGLIAIFILISAASILVSPDRNFSFYNYYHLMGRYIFIYYLVINNVQSLEQIKRLVWTVLASAMVVTGYGFYQYFHGVDISAFQWVDGEQFPDLKVRVFSTLKNPNLLAGFLVMIMALVCGLGCKAREMKNRLLFLFLFILFGACLGLTYSRGAWISVGFVIALYGVLYNKRILWLLLLVPVALYLAHDGFTERLMSIFNPTDTSSTLRIALWESTVAMIVDKPLLGIGWGAYWLVYPQYDFFIQDATTTIFHAHNMYLNIAAEIGIPGLLVFLTIMVGHIRTALSVIHEVTERWVAGLLLGLIAALFGIAVNGFTDFIMFNIQLSMLFWLFNAMIVAIWQQNCSVQNNVTFTKKM
ncbi:exopolysaccharide biosynthesis protein [Sporomusaceae bacterium FL31]|nr:exopolysaccharide biosynthesis protein [Sporomusaceae bacterium FL31]GCE32516.1 exopolysaccharide biosynthesis protein [Sporomusaceae bacterium]